MNESSTEFDNQFSKNNVLYYPWVGQSYKNTTPKVLVVGESHYYDSDCEKDEFKKNEIDKNHYFTRECYKEQFDVFKNIQAVLSNNLIQNEFIADKIAFYNFFTKCIGYGARDKQFEKKYLEETRQNFFKILTILTPNIVIVLGKSKMWDWMPLNACEINGYAYYYKQYPNSKIIHIMHPSAQKSNLCDTSKEIKSFFENNGFFYPLLDKIGRKKYQK